MEFKLTKLTEILTKLTEILNINNGILNATVILLTLFITVNIFRCESKNIKSFKENKDNELKRNETLANINQLEEKINSYKKIFDKNKRDIPLLLNTINNTAKESEIKINSIKPGTEERHPEYIKYLFDLALETKSYHNIGKFISSLESYADIYFIDKLNIKLAEKRTEIGSLQMKKGQEQTYILAADLTLSTIVLKE